MTNKTNRLFGVFMALTVLIIVLSIVACRQVRNCMAQSWPCRLPGAPGISSSFTFYLPDEPYK